jgi:cell division protein FtsB
VRAGKDALVKAKAALEAQLATTQARRAVIAQESHKLSTHTSTHVDTDVWQVSSVKELQLCITELAKTEPVWLFCVLRCCRFARARSVVS